MNDVPLRDLVGLGGVPLVAAAVQFVKLVAPETPARVYPLLALVFGVLLNAALAVQTAATLIEIALVGIMTGLAASGLYDHARSLTHPPPPSHTPGPVPGGIASPPSPLNE